MPQSPAFTLVTLKKRAEFLRMNGQAKWVTPSFIMLCSPQKTPEHAPRFGFTVTKKVGNAPERNRIKRRLREAVRTTAEGLAKPGHDYVLIARDSALHCDYETLLRDLQFAFARIGKPSEPKVKKT